MDLDRFSLIMENACPNFGNGAGEIEATRAASGLHFPWRRRKALHFQKRSRREHECLVRLVFEPPFERLILRVVEG